MPVPGDDVPRDYFATTIDAGLSTEIPRVLGRPVIVVRADEAGAVSDVRATPWVLEQKQDRRFDARLGWIEPGHRILTMDDAEPADKVAQGRNMRLVNYRAAA